MRGDVIRALIELITNSDDAYGNSDGPILIRVLKTGEDAQPVEIRVHDSAKGLTAEGLQKCFAVLGGERAEEEDDFEARGLLGRGAKDVASLGFITFAAIRDGKYSRLTLDSLGDWELTDVDVPADDGHRDALGLEPSENGLTASLFVQKRFTVPSRIKLQEKLSQHAQLRDLIDRRIVRLQDLRDEPFFVRLESRAVRGDVVVDKDVALVGWDVPVHLTVRRLPQRVNGSVTEYSEHGLLVRSGVTVFENTWFDLDGRPEANFFAGEVTAPEVAQIIRAFDKKEDAGGPVRLLSRDRDGLVANHPYRKELARAVAHEVQPLFDVLAGQMNARRKQGENLSKAFDVAGAALKDQVNAVLNEIEDDDQGGGTGTAVFEDLVIIPPRRVSLPGEALTFTVRSRTLPKDDLSVSVDTESADDVVGAIAADTAEWSPHPRLEAFQSRIFVTAGLAQGSATIRVEVGQHVARATIVVVDEAEHDKEPPTSLEVSPARASVSPTRGKRFAVRAPIDFCDRTLAVGYEGVELAHMPEGATLLAEPGGRWSEALLRCKAGTAKGTGRMTVSLDDGASAVSDITVDETAGRGGLDIDFELTAFKSPPRRVDLRNDHGQILVRVYAMHPSFNGLFGKYLDDESKFTDEDSAQSRAVLAEVVGAELANHLTERDYARHPERLNDAPRVLRRRSELANRFLVILHRALAPVGS
jgi:hypothetical protein